MKKLFLFTLIVLIAFAVLLLGCKFNPDDVASPVFENKSADDSSNDQVDEKEESQAVEEEAAEEEVAEEEDDEELEDTNNENIAPSIELVISEGPLYSEDDGVCYYRIKAIVEGYPKPEIAFSRDDSEGSFGENIVQVNLYNENDSYKLTATAKNEEGESQDSIMLTWGCEKPKEDEPFSNDFTLNDISGNKVNLSDFQGNTIVLNFWATWCGPCVAEIPAFVEVYNEYKDKGVVFVGISLDSDINDLIQFVREYGINYPILFDNKNVNDIWKIEGIPTTFILDKNGNILTKRVGSMMKQDLINLIESNM